ncbi:DCP2-domain-containing protein [Pisolithus croceorrhizus]|nr:DCP2-domain-containing protein [Pisolithus croceorrhizus]
MTSSSSSSPEMQPASTADTTERFTYKHATHEEVLEDLSSRFLLNLPEEELSSLERICFQVEQAHWFYEDFVREQNPKFPSLPLKKFSAMLFHACPLLHQWSHDHEQAFNTFMQYKTRVPVCGAIMLNESWEKCILVKGWKSSSGWGFPKGKINEHEPPHECAVREVLEETGYNLAGKINPTDVIEMSIKEQLISLFIVPGIPDDFPFKTRTRKEISRIEWFKLTDLPTWKRNKASPGKFYLISPFIAALKAFITARKPSVLGLRNSKATLEATVETGPQESGSSSADNGEPHTPSSQSSEGAPAGNHLSIMAPPSDDEKALPSQPVDPHVARLLTSLSLSAKKTDLKSASMVPDTRQSVETSPRLVRNGTPPATRPHYSSVKYPGADYRIQHSETGPLVHTNDPPFSKSGIFQDTYISNAGAAPASSSPSYGASHEPSSMAFSTSLPSLGAPSQAIVTKQSPSSRRTSSTADISPYLRTSAEVPTSGKRLKQLALLELVADESSKMTPTLAPRELPTSRTYDFPSHRHPGPCASVPPSTTYETLSQRQLQYDSSGGAPGSLQRPRGTKVSMPLGQLHHSLLTDPFHTRSQSSHLDCYNPAYTPCTQTHPVVHQGQPFSLPAGYSPSGRAEPHSSLLHPAAQHPLSLSSAACAPQYTTSAANILPVGCPSRVSRSSLATQTTLPPLPRLPPPSSAQLLSILNSGGQVSGRVPPTRSPPVGYPSHVG